MKRKTDDKLITFSHIPKEERWNTCINAIQQDFHLTIKDICKMLKCSRSWVNRYIQPHLHYIYLGDGFGNGKADYLNIARKALQNKELSGSVLYSVREYEALIQSSISDITRQTIKVPIEILIEPDHIERFNKLYIPKEERMELRYTDLSEYLKVKKEMELLLLEYATEEGKQILNNLPCNTKRKLSKEIGVIEKIDITKFQAVHDIKDYGDTDEEIYRSLFDAGVCRFVLKIPDADGVISEKVYYYQPEQRFDDASTKEMILINYYDYINLLCDGTAGK